MVDEYYEDIVNVLNTRREPEGYTIAQKNPLVVKFADYQSIVFELHKMGRYEILC